MNPSQLRIVPTTKKVTEKLASRADYVSEPGVTPEVGDKNSAGVRQDVAIVGECARFDLSDTSDRCKYAELSARLFSGADCVKLWEERIHSNDSVVVFISYINYTNVFQNSSHTINLKD